MSGRPEEKPKVTATIQWRLCGRCGEYKDAAVDFYRDPRKSYRCRACLRAEMLARYAPIRAWVTAYKLEHGCVDCGYREHPAALEFDHMPGHEKTAPISMLILRRADLETIKAEIAKCELVCANCHRVRTMERGNFGANHDLNRTGVEVSDATPPFEQLRWKV